MQEKFPEVHDSDTMPKRRLGQLLYLPDVPKPEPRPQYVDPGDVRATPEELSEIHSALRAEDEAARRLRLGMNEEGIIEGYPGGTTNLPRRPRHASYETRN